MRDFYGTGPTRTKTYVMDDLVVCIMRGGFTRVEQTLLESGRRDAVSRQRVQFQEAMRERFVAVVENATGRRVIGFMASSQQTPDMLCEVFLLAPSDLLEDPPTTAETSPRSSAEPGHRAAGS
jgi:uncharacterized protein YbcI